MHAETVDQRPAYSAQDFVSQAERDFHLTRVQAGQVAQEFAVAGRPNYVDYHKFCETVRVEQHKYVPIVNRFRMELDCVKRAIQTHKSGVYKWFRQFMDTHNSENDLSMTEFERAIRAADSHMVSAASINELFSQLNFSGRGRVAISDVEAMFKQLERSKRPNFSIHDTEEKIVRAFNGDINFVEAELERITRVNNQQLPIEEATRFFEGFNGFQNFCSLDELAYLLEEYALSNGNIELRELIKALTTALHVKPQLRSANTQGIHRLQLMNQGGSVGHESMTPLRSFASYTEDGTESSKNLQLIRPAAMPLIDDVYIEQLQKACFVQARTVKDFFDNFAGTGSGAAQGGALSR